jgi:hypothetical protein
MRAVLVSRLVSRAEGEGTGSKRQRRPGVWELRVSAGWDKAAGRYRQVSHTVYGDEAEAQDALDELIADVAAGRPPARKKRPKLSEADAALAGIERHTHEISRLVKVVRRERRAGR